MTTALYIFGLMGFVSTLVLLLLAVAALRAREPRARSDADSGAPRSESVTADSSLALNVVYLDERRAR